MCGPSSRRATDRCRPRNPSSPASTARRYTAPAPRRPAPRSSRCGSGSSSRAPRYSRRRAAAAGCRRAGAAAGGTAVHRRQVGVGGVRRVIGGGGRRRIGLRLGRARGEQGGRGQGPQEGKPIGRVMIASGVSAGRGSIAVTIIVVRPGVGGVIVVIRRRPVVGRPRRHHHASAQHAGQGKHQHQALFMEGRVSVGARRSPSAGRQACPICAVCGVWGGFPCSWLLRASGARAAPVLRSQELGHLPRRMFGAVIVPKQLSRDRCLRAGDRPYRALPGVRG